MTLACASALVKKRIYRDLVDFDNHLDDLSQVETERERDFTFLLAVIKKARKVFTVVVFVSFNGIQSYVQKSTIGN